MDIKKLFINKYYLVTTIFWATIFLFVWVQSLVLSPLLEATLLCLLLFGSVYPLSYFLSNKLLKRAMINKEMGRFAIQFVIISLIQSFLGGLGYVISFKLEQMGIFEPSHIYREMNILLEMLSFLPSSILFNIAFCGFRFYYEHTRLETLHTETQLQMLKSQITPHFMFNVLNHIYILMQEDVQLASSLLLKYSNILRFQLYKGEEGMITIEQDVQFLKDFIDIETIRWEDKIKIEAIWQIEDKTKEIPPLLFITLIENAFKHVSRTNSEKGFIKIFFSQKGEEFTLDVENSKSSQHLITKDRNGLGLQNLKDRLRILYENNFTLKIEEDASVFHVCLNIKANRI